MTRRWGKRTGKYERGKVKRDKGSILGRELGGDVRRGKITGK